MRPGAAGTVGTGGMMNRQPRASWLVGLALGVGGVAAWYILRISRRARGHEKTALADRAGRRARRGRDRRLRCGRAGSCATTMPPPKITPPTTTTTTPRRHDHDRRRRDDNDSDHAARRRRRAPRRPPASERDRAAARPLRGGAPVPARHFQRDAHRRARRRPLGAGRRADRRGQDPRRRVRDQRRARVGREDLLHDPAQGAVEPEVRRLRPRSTAPRTSGC